MHVAEIMIDISGNASSVMLLPMSRTMVYVQLKDAEQPAAFEADTVEENKKQGYVVIKRFGQIVVSLDTKCVICWWKKIDKEDERPETT